MNRPAAERPRRAWRLPVLALSLLALSVLHQSGGVRATPLDEIFDVVPHLLIIVGAIWFGLTGGLACALLTGTCYMSHLLIHQSGDILGEHLDQTLNVAMFLVVGAVTGYLSERQLTAMDRYRSVAAELERSYEELKSRTAELLRAEEHLRRANRLTVVSELTAGLAHEIGNPLGGIKGAAEILADGVDPGGERQRFAGLLLKEVDRLHSVVSRFLDAVRSEESSDERADVGEVLDLALSLCRKAMEEGEIDLETSVDPDLPAVRASPDRLEQVFLNLLLNAIQATPPGGDIRLHAERAGDRVLVRVSDTGQGIDPEVAPRIFDPFFTTRREGTGLGLAITHKILESCGAAVSVESHPPGGSTFTVTLRTAESEPCRPEES